MRNVEQAIARTIGDHGRIDVLINNAGIIQVGPVNDMKVSDYDDAMKAHFWGPLFMVLVDVAAHAESRRGEGSLTFHRSEAGFLFRTWCRIP